MQAETAAKRHRVAVLGSATFNAADVNPATVTLEGAEVRPQGKSGNYGSLEGVNIVP